MSNDHLTIQPFQLIPVLDALFEVCDLKTLKTLRLVCREWECLSQPTFASRTKIDLAKSSYHQLEEIVQHVEMGRDLPTYNLTIHMAYIQNIPKIRDVIVAGGKHLHSLKISIWNLTKDHCDQPFISQMVCSPSHLLCLELGILSESLARSCIFSSPIMHEWPTLWRLRTLVMYGKMPVPFDFMVNLFSAMPNIEVMKIESACTDFLDYMLPALSKVRLQKLHSIMLSVLDNLTIFHIQHLIHANLNLRTLHIKNRYTDESPVGYEKLFRQYAFSLNDLAINCTCSFIETTNFLNVPVMPFLNKLKLHSLINGDCIWKLQFLNKLPNLQSLTIANEKCSLQNLCIINSDKTNTHYKLEHLDINDMQRTPLNMECLEGMIKLFPHLNSLSFTADDSSLQLIYQHVPQLKRLVIFGGSNITDKGITGLVFASRHKTSNPVDMSVSLGITSLKYLRTIRFDSTLGTIAITDASIIHGLTHLERLTFASFTYCDITEKGLGALQKSFVKTEVNLHRALWSGQDDPFD